jgi:predicted lipoprotein
MLRLRSLLTVAAFFALSACGTRTLPVASDTGAASADTGAAASDTGR